MYISTYLSPALLNLFSYKWIVHQNQSEKAHNVYIPLSKLQEQVNLLYVPQPIVILSLQ